MLADPETGRAVLLVFCEFAAPQLRCYFVPAVGRQNRGRAGRATAGFIPASRRRTGENEFVNDQQQLATRRHTFLGKSIYLPADLSEAELDGRARLRCGHEPEPGEAMLPYGSLDRAERPALRMRRHRGLRSASRGAVMFRGQVQESESGVRIGWEVRGKSPNRGPYSGIKIRALAENRPNGPLTRWPAGR